MAIKGAAIVGAGPAGLTVARELALHDIPVTVYEGKKNVIDDTEKASGIISINGLESLGIDYHPAIVNDLWGAVLHAGTEELRVRSKKRIAHVVSRAKLAQIMYKAAVAAGAEIKMGRRLDRESIRGLDSEVIIGADGAVSNVASAFGFPEIKEYVLTYKAEYEGVPKPEDETMVELFFQKEAQRLFGWTVPYGGTNMEVGIGITKKAKVTSSAAFESFFKASLMERMGKARQVSGLASIIPLEPRRRTVSGKVLLVGDAAGQVKATTGGGIVFGSMCSRVAADVIVGHFTKGRDLMLYESAWRRKYGNELKMHSVMHEYYSIAGEKGLERFFKLAKILGAERFLSEYGDMDRPGVMLRRLFTRRK
jgi:flavin-dependent dehydrogenase